MTCVFVLEVFLFCISDVTNPALWLQDFNKLTYLHYITHLPYHCKAPISLISVDVLIPETSHQNDRFQEQLLNAWGQHCPTLVLPSKAHL